MGRPKALLPLDAATSFLSRIVHTLTTGGADDVVVVLGHEAEAVQADLGRRGVTARVIVNPDYDAGQFSSLLAGLAAVDRPGVRAVLMTLVDVPLVSVETVRAVLARYAETGAPVVRPVRGDAHGHPVLLDRSVFDALRGADPSMGAKPVVRARASRQGDVEVDDPGAFLDIDTPEDYARIVDARVTGHGPAGG